MTRFAATRTALLPALQDAAPTDLVRALADGGPSLEALILTQELGPLWFARTNAAAFAESHLSAAKFYMRQVAALREIDEVFSEGAIRYAVIKGAATRELLFDSPMLRVCGDIDILVSPGQRVEAARRLVAAGYQLRVNPTVASHEVALLRGPVVIDLHWDILRPGRTRIPVADGLLARRQRHGAMWMLADDDALSLMLVHTAVSKHLSTSFTGLHRVADIMFWLQRRRIDWPAVRDRLAAAGLMTAAWTVLRWVRLLSPRPMWAVLDPPLQALRPGHLRSAYLSAWLERDLSTSLRDRHALRLLGFSVLLHDRPSDAWSAFRSRQWARTASPQDVEAFRKLAE